MRIVSLVPAATEIVASLGQLHQLVGISHECDYPVEVVGKPRVTRCDLPDAPLSSAEVDQWVRSTLATVGSLYRLDESLLRQLEPDVLITQRLCDVCAVGYGSVQAFAAGLPGRPQVLNLEPSTLADIFENIRQVGQVLGVQQAAELQVHILSARVQEVRSRVADVADRPVCFLLEWIDPPYCSGHWGPELVALAGGHDPIGRLGQASVIIPWESVLAAHPDVIVVSCCGYPVSRTMKELPLLRGYPGWQTLPAVRHGRVYIVDGNAYFSRPGPRIVDSLEILAEILHPDLFSGYLEERGVVRVRVDELHV